MKLDSRGSFGLIALLVTVVIIVVVAAIYFGGSGGTTVKKDSALLDSKSKKVTVLGQAMDTAKAADCRERMNQIRTGIATFKATGTDDSNPKSFRDIGLSVAPTYFQCPVSNQPYTYDPTTGTAKCPTHTNF